MTTALLLGAHGFTAGHLANRLSQLGDVRVVGADLRAGAVDGFAECAAVDIADSEQVINLVRRLKPDWIFNLAGLMGGDARDIYRVNVLGTINVMEAVRQEANDARVLLVGSAAEYGKVEPTELPIGEEQTCRPVGHYAVSKHAAVLAGLSYARTHRLKVVVARPFNIVGAGVPAALVVGAVLRRAREALASGGEPIVRIGNLETQRDFVSVEDTVEAYLGMIRGEHWGEVFNICSGTPRRIRGVVEMALSHSPRPVRLEVDPALVRPADVEVVYGSWEKASRLFGYRPVTGLEESMKRAWDYEMSGEGI